MIEEKRQKLALVVGNDIYPAPFRSLLTATTDAGRVAGFLEQRLGFDVTPLNNRTASEVMATLSSLVKKLTDDSQFFFYFAGHGLCVGASPKQSLLCSDASELLLDGVDSAGAISPAALAAFSRKGRGDMFFCLDVCRTQTLQQKGGPEIQRGGAGLRDAVARPNGRRGAVRGRRLTLSSCEDGKGASDDGAFANAFIRELTKLKDAGVEGEIGQYLVGAIARRLRFSQIPQLDGSPFSIFPGTPILNFIRDESRRLLTEGEDLLKQGDAAGALVKAEEALEVLPEDALALDLKERATVLLSERETLIIAPRFESESPAIAPQPESEPSPSESQPESETSASESQPESETSAS